MKLQYLTSIVALTSFTFVGSAAGDVARIDATIDTTVDADVCSADDDTLDDDDGGWIQLDDLDEEAEPGDIVINGKVLYFVEVYGYGLCPQFGYNRAVRKATEACTAAGGVLQLQKPNIHAYDISAFGWCYVPNK